jgi:hypothetical protein
MINPVQTSIPQPDGSHRFVIIEPILKRDGDQRLRPGGVFKIFKDASGDQTHLFTEPAEGERPASELPDEQNPDYLGEFVFQKGSLIDFRSLFLSEAEQAYLAGFIATYRES